MSKLSKFLSYRASLQLIAIAAVATTFSSCVSSTTPVAHRHGNTVHKHILPKSGSDHSHPNLDVTPAQPKEIKPMLLGHQHHTHKDRKTSKESVPC